MRCPESPRDLGLPKDAWWPGQKETVDLILEAFIEHGKKYVMAGIPTGGGKTLIAAAVQKLLSRAGIGTGDSLALTHTIQLQRQYVETLPEARVLIGRRNFACELPQTHIARILDVNLNASDAPCAEGHKCDSDLDNADGCGYYRQRAEAVAAPMVVTNYAMAPLILLPEDRNGENPFRRTLLVADECHLAERSLIESAGYSCRTRVIEDATLHQIPGPETKTIVMEGRSQRAYETIATWIHWARGALPEVDSAYAETKQQLTSIMKSEIRSVDEAKKLKYKLHSLNAARLFTATLARINDADQAAWTVNRKDSEVTVQPLWGWTAAPRLLWQYFDRVLLMSATPGDPEIERVKLGIGKDEFIYLERPSTFPVENRVVYYWPVAKLNYQSSDSDWMKVAKAIVQIGEGDAFKRRKGLVHSGSKANAQRLVVLLNMVSQSTRYFTHDSQEGRRLTREEALDEFKSTPEPRVLVTASFTTGLDLPYIIGWQVIAKIPFGSLADEVTARRRAFIAADGAKFGQQVYAAETMNSVVQAAGRIVRAPEDSGPTFILDQAYQMLHRNAFMPQYYRDAFRRLQIEV